MPKAGDGEQGEKLNFSAKPAVKTKILLNVFVFYYLNNKKWQ